MYSRLTPLIIVRSHLSDAAQCLAMVMQKCHAHFWLSWRHKASRTQKWCSQLEASARSEEYIGAETQRHGAKRVLCQSLLVLPARTAFTPNFQGAWFYNASPRPTMIRLIAGADALWLFTLSSFLCSNQAVLIAMFVATFP